MTSKRVRDLTGKIAQPRTKHEEIMFCIESTNEIVSKHSERLDAIAELLKLILARKREST